MIIERLDKEKAIKNIKELIKIDNVIQDDPWKEDNFLLSLNYKWELSLIALEKNEIIGFLICSLKENSIHIHRIAVIPEYQNKKVGSLLMETLIDNCNKLEIKKVTLKVKNNNYDAFKFYKKLGFKILGIENSRYFCTKNL